MGKWNVAYDQVGKNWVVFFRGQNAKPQGKQNWGKGGGWNGKEKGKRDRGGPSSEW